VELPANARAPARAVGAILRGDVLLEQAAGEAGGGACCAVDTIFSVASISKLMLAVVALQCAERGELSLDEDVNARLPPVCRLAHPTHAGAPVTPRMLLTHCSGLCDDESALHVGRWRTAGADCPVTLADYVAARTAAPDAAQLWHAERPGAAPYHYSNLGMTALALFVETCCGASLAALARERVFAPLGMTRTAFTLAEARALPGARLASPHADGAELGLYGVAEWPAAGLRSTVRDLLRFLAQFTGDADACTLLSRASLAAMLPPDFTRGLAWWGADATYGEPQGGVWSHGGFMDGVRSHLYYFPAQRVGIVLLQAGEGDYEDVVEDVKDAVLAAGTALHPEDAALLAGIILK
jgi:CubicO group peptidase (beta-lactamase class C family)